jgi:mono/diheme cytochrome c family protein
VKKIALFVGVAVMALGIGMGTASAKAPWKKDLGVENCAVCHLDEKKAENPSNKLWKASKDMNDKVKAGKGEFAGKTCGDCHKGALKPAK